MAAQQVGDVDPEKRIILGRLLHRTGKGGDGVDAPGTADEQLALVLGVEVEQIFALQHPFAQLESSRETGLLVDRKERFQRPVLGLRVDQHGQRGGHADAAVGPERGPLGPHPPVGDVGADGVVVEIELHVGILLADHIHMRL